MSTRARRRWTLRRTLVVGTSALVAAALIAMSAATVLALRSFVVDRLDEQVLGGLSVSLRPFPGDDRFTNGQPPGAPAPRIGTLQVTLDDTGAATSSSYTQADGTEISLSDEQVAALSDATEADRVPTTVELGGDFGTDLGSFRVAAAPTTDGGRVIAGSSLADVEATTSALLVILAIVASLTLLAAVTGLTLLVRRNLRPLARVADVAEHVSALPLADGETAISERVAQRDTDPDTEVGRVGTSLNGLLRHVETALSVRRESEDRLRRFVADASHELRTPLASIRGYAQLSRGEGAPMTPTQARSLDRIESEAVRMAALVDDLLLLARLDAGQRLRDEEVELTLLAVDAVSDAHAADPDREWRLEVDEKLVTVRGDGNRIRQVIANLLRNAQAHTPPGTVVTVSLDSDATDAVLRVSDTGPGIDESIASTLFDRFTRGDDARNRDAGSTGLGLSIARAIVDAHGGSITARSTPGDTTFTVRLPLRQPFAVALS
ncbi:sensor histidine kinase [Microbacterium radiodurans]|uniref:histidine kinase n=1 Tax=Microbacterium radiodurans TaxID=661398 RepID=A0A5J5IQR3_9MICO|nr:HAMP domain-containing sensor histidine kinase [Microbacterium radiodurans]KAA9083788.1 HAMP domain-containing histidine kinase [Microbacterium radiodurans]